MKCMILTGTACLALLSFINRSNASALSIGIECQRIVWHRQAVLLQAQLDQMRHQRNPFNYNANALQFSDPSAVGLTWKLQAMQHQREAQLLRSFGW